MTPFSSPAVEAKFDSYPKEPREKLIQMRELIFQLALTTKGVLGVEETLKWGEPSYVTSKSKSGSTIRIDWKPKFPAEYAIYFNCKTTLVSTFREMMPELSYEGNRAIKLKVSEPVPVEDISECIAMALTYHMHKKST